MGLVRQYPVLLAICTRALIKSPLFHPPQVPQVHLWCYLDAWHVCSNLNYMQQHFVSQLLCSGWPLFSFFLEHPSESDARRSQCKLGPQKRNV